MSISKTYQVEFVNAVALEKSLVDCGLAFSKTELPDTKPTFAITSKSLREKKYNATEFGVTFSCPRGKQKYIARAGYQNINGLLGDIKQHYTKNLFAEGMKAQHFDIEERYDTNQDILLVGEVLIG